jgi:hypothetical protein
MLRGKCNTEKEEKKGLETGAKVNTYRKQAREDQKRKMEDKRNVYIV